MRIIISLMVKIVSWNLIVKIEIFVFLWVQKTVFPSLLKDRSTQHKSLGAEGLLGKIEAHNSKILFSFLFFPKIYIKFQFLRKTTILCLLCTRPALGLRMATGWYGSGFAPPRLNSTRLDTRKKKKTSFIAPPRLLQRVPA